jgi:NAD(P)-dependent dehydrogenase (short-subunit alcohol dehydrogenase family)
MSVDRPKAFGRNMRERRSRPIELIGAALFLVSNASSFVTGTSLIVDGGCTAR